MHHATPELTGSATRQVTGRSTGAGREVAGEYLGQADQLPLVAAIGADESWVALVAWLLTFLAMLRHLVRTVAPTRTTGDGTVAVVA